MIFINNRWYSTTADDIHLMWTLFIYMIYRLLLMNISSAQTPSRKNMSYAIFQYFSSERASPNWIFDDFMFSFRSLWVLEQFFLRKFLKNNSRTCRKRVKMKCKQSICLCKQMSYAFIQISFVYISFSLFFCKFSKYFWETFWERIVPELITIEKKS
jgi:hypothetical protein